MPPTSLESAYRSALAARMRARAMLREESLALLGRLALRGDIARAQRDSVIAAERDAAHGFSADAGFRDGR